MASMAWVSGGVTTDMPTTAGSSAERIGQLMLALGAIAAVGVWVFSIISCLLGQMYCFCSSWLASDEEF